LHILFQSPFFNSGSNFHVHLLLREPFPRYRNYNLRPFALVCNNLCKNVATRGIQPIARRAGCAILVIISIILIGMPVGAARAQPHPTVSPSLTIDERNRLAGEAMRKRDFPAALELVRTSADRGDAKSQFMVGQFHYYGWGVPINRQEAMSWYRKAADQGDAEGADSVARLFHSGSGVPRDYQEAMTWFRRAADRGYAPSQAAICAMYIAGEGVPVDFEEGTAWCKKSADQGYAAAQRVLGVGYLNGQGVPKDLDKAVVWLRRAAEQGDAESQLRMGNLYRRGDGLPQDNDLARAWYRKAMAQKNEGARTALAAMDAEDRNPGFRHPERIPPHLQTICFLDNPMMLRITRLDKSEQESVTRKYSACLRANWKRITRGAPFPAD
jgi:TPR repeat protein